MTAEDLEREIRRSPTMNERFLLGLLDEARSKIARAQGIRWDHFGDEDYAAGMESAREQILSVLTDQPKES